MAETSETYDQWLGQQGSRRRGGKDTRKPWQRGGFKNKAAYDAAVKKDPSIEEILADY
tara:strand:+ start:51 stop:224 length:174 start_codon:yes stop_codon:yes gene_type:complete